MAVAALALAAVVVAGITTAGGEDARPAGGRSLAAAKEALAGAPPALANLHEQANELLDGGAEAFERRLAALEGYPVVVNKWASWCGPCRAEFPHFQNQAVKHGNEVAFIGVDTSDDEDAARRFLRDFPVPYPHYKDPDSEVAAVFGAVAAFPSTAFYDSEGELAFLKQGAYPSEAALAEDIERYAR